MVDLPLKAPNYNGEIDYLLQNQKFYIFSNNFDVLHKSDIYRSVSPE